MVRSGQRLLRSGAPQFRSRKPKHCLSPRTSGREERCSPDTAEFQSQSGDERCCHPVTRVSGEFVLGGGLRRSEDLLCPLALLGSGVQIVGDRFDVGDQRGQRPVEFNHFGASVSKSIGSSMAAICATRLP